MLEYTDKYDIYISNTGVVHDELLLCRLSALGSRPGTAPLQNTLYYTISWNVICTHDDIGMGLFTDLGTGAGGFIRTILDESWEMKWNVEQT